MNYVENMRKSRSNKKGCGRNRQKGGTGSFAYSFGGPVAPGAPYAAEVVRSPACQQATPPGFLNSVPQHGLPGMYGGRYTNTFEVVGPAGIAVMNPQSIPCEGAPSNPLNQVGPSRITELAASTVLPGPGVPYSTAMGPFTRVGGRRRGSKSKSKKTRRQRGGVGGPGSEFYIAPRAGYTFLPSDLTGGKGGMLGDGQTPFALNVPYSSEDRPNPACGTTGGSRTTGSKNRGSRTTGSKNNRRKNRRSKKSKKSKRSTRR
jgi:hypothetical protein